MFDEDDPRKQIQTMLPFFKEVIRSAMMRSAHRPSTLGLVQGDDSGERVEIEISLDFTDEKNLGIFDMMVMPMVRSILLAAEEHKMTAFTQGFEEPALRYAIEHGVSDKGAIAIYRELQKQPAPPALRLV
jgi:hypothetical protein